MNSQYSKYFIEFLNNNNNFKEGINKDFINKLRQSHNPHIIIIYGNPRIGKSTLLNQLLNGFKENYEYSDNEYFNLDKPFKIGHNEFEYITKGCNIFGSIKLSKLLKRNCCYSFNNNIDADLFIVDSEGIGALDNTSGFISGILTLLQVSTIKIYCTNGITRENLKDTEKLINISEIINTNNFSKQIFIENLNTRIDNFDEKKSILKALEKNRTIFQELVRQNLNNRDILNKIQCFCLPKFDLAKQRIEYEKAYKESIKTLVNAIAESIQKRNSNSNILITEINFFQGIFSEITSLHQLNNLRDALQKIFEKKAESILREIENIINISINNMDAQIFQLCQTVDNTYNYINGLISNYKRIEYELLKKAIPQELKFLKKNLAFTVYCNIDYKRKVFIKKQQEAIKNSIKDKNINGLINFVNNCYYQEEITEININKYYEDFLSKIKAKYNIFFKLYSNDINSFLLNLKENYVFNAKILISNKPEWRIKLDNHFELPEIKQMKNYISAINNLMILYQFKMNNYQYFYNELYNLRNKYGFKILKESDYIKKIEKTIREIKIEIDNQINRITLFQFQNNSKNYQLIISNLIGKLNSQKRDYDKKINDLTNEMKKLQNKATDRGEENQIIQSLIKKIALKEKLEKERENNIKNLTNQIKELENKISEPKPVPNIHDNSPPPPKQYFPITPYNGVSIVDGLKEIGQESSYDYRCEIARVNNIQNYTGQPEQNLYMLKLLKNGQLIKP